MHSSITNNSKMHDHLVRYTFFECMITWSLSKILNAWSPSPHHFFGVHDHLVSIKNFECMITWSPSLFLSAWSPGPLHDGKCSFTSSSPIMNLEKSRSLYVQFSENGHGGTVSWQYLWNDYSRTIRKFIQNSKGRLIWQNSKILQFLFIT